MNKKEKTMTASRAARELGMSRESVFTLIRQGKLMRAGYAIRNHRRVALVTVESVLYEKTRRKAAKGWRDGGMRIDRALAPKTRGGGQRIEKRGNFNAGDAYLAKKCPELAKYGLIPAAFDPADPSSIQTAAEPPSVEQECRAACLAAKVSLERSKTAAACSKRNAEACAGFKRLCAWFAFLCGFCAAVSVFCAVWRLVS